MFFVMLLVKLRILAINSCIIADRLFGIRAQDRPHPFREQPPVHAGIWDACAHVLRVGTVHEPRNMGRGAGARRCAFTMRLR
jgi:hypothetical protein